MAIIQRTNHNGGIAYQVKVRDGLGQWMPSKTFPTKVQAERYERELLSQKDLGFGAEAPEIRNLTVGEYWQKWCQECRGQVSVGWKITQDQMARDYLLPLIEGKKLLEVRPQDVGFLLERARGQGLSPQTVKHVYSLLHKIFEDAVEHYGILGQNPVLGRYRPKVPRRERAFLCPDESWRLLTYCQNHYAGPAVWLQTLSGLRPSEVQALRWDAVDLKRRQILIRSAFNNKEGRIQDHPKQEDWGMAPIPDALAKYLGERQGDSEEFVAQGPVGGMLSYETYLRVLRKLCKDAKVPNVTPHELRHSCTEMYVQAGASAEDIRRLLNQSSLTATARYMHRTDERLNGIAARIGQPDGESNVLRLAHG